MRNSRILLMCAALFFALGLTTALSAQEPKPGGYSEVSKTDSEITAAAKFAVKALKKTQGGTIKLISIEQAEQQVVAGMNYKLCLLIKTKGKTQNVTTVVYKDLKERFSLTSSEFGSCPTE